MSQFIRSTGLITAFGFFLVLINAGANLGCNGDTNNPNPSTSVGDDDAAFTATQEDADQASGAALGVATEAFNLALDASAATLNLRGDVVSALKNAIVITAASSCDEASIPTIIGDRVGTLSGSVSGSCLVASNSTQSGGDTSVVASVTCSAFDDGVTTNNAILDGNLGLEASSTTDEDSTTTAFDLSSHNLLITLDNGNNCSLRLNATIDTDVNNEGINATTTVGGCITVCGESFEMSGSETN